MAHRDVELFKRAAAERAVEYVASGMVVGLGGGSTALWAIKKIGELVERGSLREIVGIPCSSLAAHAAEARHIPLGTLEEHPRIDLTIDGADEINPSLDLIKGGGGALLREKIVSQATRRRIFVADESKMSGALGEKSKLPVETIPFGWQSQLSFLESLGGTVTARRTGDGSFYVTDQGNMLLDCDFGRITEPHWLALTLGGRAGIVEHGLFLRYATEVIVAGENGVRILKPEELCAAKGVG
jgi:ribose 5-phosphate isomerase A